MPNDRATIFEVARVLNDAVFKSAAREVFSTCKELLGASSGYIALLSEDGTENQALYLDPGGLPCRVDPSLPMPVRGLRQRVYETGKAAYENNFDNSEWLKFIPSGHSFLKNVLFAPLSLDGITIGLIGLANKEGGFSDFDADIATSFGRLAAVTLRNISIMEKLRTEEERFHSVVETANDAVICIDSNGQIVYWNNAAHQIFGYTYDEVVGKHVDLIIPRELQPQHQQCLERMANSEASNFSGKITEVNGLRRDGSSFPLEVSVAKWCNDKEYYFTAILRDITDRKLMEQDLRQKEEQIQSAFDYAAVGMIIATVDAKFVKVNRSFCDMLGYSEQELQGRSGNEFAHPDDRGKEMPFVIQLLNGEIDSFQLEKRYISKSGHTVWASVILSLTPANHNVTKYLIAQVQDVTEQKKVQQDLLMATQKLRKVNEDLMELSKHKSQFLANMSHELRTPLTAILALSDEMLIQRYGLLNKKQQEKITIIRNSGEKLLILIDELLEFSKIESGQVSLKLGEVCVGATIKEVIQFLRPLAKQKQISIRADIQDTIRIIADMAKVRQVAINLLGNAIKFSPLKGEIKVEVFDQPDPEEGVELRVTDSGPGIPVQERDRIFDTFYQVDGGLNKKHQGTGLGLALVKKIMDLHLGTVNVENLKDSKGAVFKAVWPAYPCYQDDLD